MKIAICDDDYGICEELSKWLRKADNDSRKQMIEVFQEAEKLLTSIQNGAVYDLLYLDVELPDINGVESRCTPERYGNTGKYYICVRKGYLLQGYV